MAERPVLRRRQAAPAKPIVEEEEIEDIDVDDVDDVDDVEEDYEEDEAPVVKRAATKAPAPVAKAAPAPVVKRAAPAPAPAPAPVAKAAPAKAAVKAAPAPVEEEEVEEEVTPVKAASVKVKPVAETAVGSLFIELVSAMQDGSIITITKIADNKWNITSGTPVAEKKGLKGNDYWREVLDQAYIDWSNEWTAMTAEARIKKAKAAKVTWKEDPDPRVNIMRCTEAYRTALGIEKYKPQYRSRKERRLLMAGE